MQPNAMHHAKKKALAALIHHMRKMEMTEGSPEEEKTESKAQEAAEDGVIEPDMSDLEDTEAAEAPGEAPDAEDMNEDPKAHLKHFMKQSGKLRPKGHTTVMIAMGKSPVGQMKKTFGK